MLTLEVCYCTHFQRIIGPTQRVYKNNNISNTIHCVLDTHWLFYLAIYIRVNNSCDLSVMFMDLLKVDSHSHKWANKSFKRLIICPILFQLIGSHSKSWRLKVGNGERWWVEQLLEQIQTKFLNSIAHLLFSNSWSCL